MRNDLGGYFVLPPLGSHFYSVISISEGLRFLMDDEPIFKGTVKFLKVVQGEFNAFWIELVWIQPSSSQTEVEEQ